MYQELAFDSADQPVACFATTSTLEFCKDKSLVFLGIDTWRPTSAWFTGLIVWNSAGFSVIGIGTTTADDLSRSVH